MINLNEIFLNKQNSPNHSNITSNNNNQYYYNDENQVPNQDPNDIEFYNVNNINSRTGTINNIDDLQKLNANQSLITDSSFNEPSLQYDDSRGHTCDVIYELNRRKKLAGNLRHRLVIFLKTIFFINLLFYKCKNSRFS